MEAPPNYDDDNDREIYDQRQFVKRYYRIGSTPMTNSIEAPDYNNNVKENQHGQFIF